MRKMQFSRKTGRPIDKPGEQLIVYPLSFSDSDSNPLKGQKSYTTRTLETRYKAANPPVFIVDLPWRPQCSITEGMFIINTKPLGSHKILADYARFLLTRFIVTQFNKGSYEVHVMFDKPDKLESAPKYFEHTRRDASAKVAEGHCCNPLSSTTKIPCSTWRKNFINCRYCKRTLVKFLCQYFLHNIQTHLQPQQTRYVAGGFEDPASDTVWSVTGTNRAQPRPQFTCNAGETDTRLWLHVKLSTYSRILILSPDTDVYNIGLPLESATRKDVVVQISAINCRQLDLVNVTALVTALSNDPDLADVNPAVLPKVLQAMYVCTGCDYISFFSKVGKATFLRYFFQFASFITSGHQPHTPHSC